MNYNIQNYYSNNLVEAGCDEVGVGCLAGPIVAAAVILPRQYNNDSINDSKLLSYAQRVELDKEIKSVAKAWSIGVCSNGEVDLLNPKKASLMAMHRAISKLEVKPEFLLIDGNIFIPYEFIPYKCIVKGDKKYLSIAAASIIAKMYRDLLMKQLHQDHPCYDWKNNVGYPTKKHIDAIESCGITKYHRMTYGICKNKNKLDILN